MTNSYVKRQPLLFGVLLQRKTILLFVFGLEKLSKVTDTDVPLSLCQVSAALQSQRSTKCINSIQSHEKNIRCTWLILLQPAVYCTMRFSSLCQAASVQQSTLAFWSLLSPRTKATHADAELQSAATSSNGWENQEKIRSISSKFIPILSIPSEFIAFFQYHQI
jgi:hypothetical protein